MTSSDVVSERLDNHKLSSSPFQKPVEVVRWFGAVQAQDFNAAKWALALRIPGATNALIEKAFNEGKILRTHLMRPTWHFVAPDDIRWLLQLTAPRVNIKSGPNYRKLELDDATFKRSNKVLTNALKGGKHLTRSALRTVLNNSGIAADDTVRLAHIFLRAELDAVVCSGRLIGNQFTYALFDERVPATKALDREEALARLTRRYFTSHGPATLQDFVWWSGLTAVDASRGIGLVDRHLKEALVEGRAYWNTRSMQNTPRSVPSAYLLPAFDEYTVAYKDRSAILDLNHGMPSMTSMGLLDPMIIVDGKTVGTWKRTNDKKSVSITLNVLRALTKSERQVITKALERYENFLGVPVQILGFAQEPAEQAPA